jgi:hypothetical protein
MIITVSSPDKLTLSMFSDFFKSLYSSDVKLVDLTCLYSPEIIDSKMLELATLSQKSKRDILIKYKTKPQTKELPQVILDSSDVVIKFEIYSLEPEIIKAKVLDVPPIIDRWKKNIERFNKEKF